MNPEIKEKWLAALRSGEYEQGVGRLASIDNEGNKAYCCLGVLCDLAVKSGLPIDTEQDAGLILYDGNGWTLPPHVRSWAGMDVDNPKVTLKQDFEHWNENDAVLSYTVRAGEMHEVAPLNDAGYTFAEIADLIEESL